MDTDRLEKAAARAKRSTLILFVLFLFLTASLLAAAGVWRYRHTFTPEKWAADPASRQNLVEDLLKTHPLVGLTREEVLGLLGDADGGPDSFKISRERFSADSVLIYYLGVCYVDDCWLILPLEQDRAVRCFVDVT